MSAGPLSGIRVIEFAGIGPGPFCGMLLSDMGADVIRIDRIGTPGGAPSEVTKRGRRSVALDLKHPASIGICLDLMGKADALIEGFRPGVMERLGLGPEAAFSRNPRLVYGRMTGWGQEGPLAHAAGHDINYIAISGALHAIGTAEKPIPPINLVGDFGGGSLYLAMGLLAGILSARETGRGQVVDAAVCDGAISLMSMFYGFFASGYWKDERAANLIDGGAHFYDTFQCSDGKWISIGPIEPHFYTILLQKAGITDEVLVREQRTRDRWPEMHAKMKAVFATATRDEWCARLEGTDACFAPVLGLAEAPSYEHNVARNAFVEIAGVVQPAPSPRFSATPGAIQRPPADTGQHSEEVFAEWGVSQALVSALSADRAAGA